MGEFEPKETGLQRTVWLFEREILEKLENTDLEDHHTVLKFNLFSMKYEIKPKFDNGRADAIVMRNTANHWFKIWFKAFSACSCDQQSKIEQLEKKLKAVEEIMNDYYTGSFEDAPELAGLISLALSGECDEND